MARQFFGGNPQGSSTGPSFAMSHHLPLPEMARMQEMNGSIGPDVDEVWAREHQFHHLGDSKVQAAWGAEFGSGPPQSLSGPSMPQEMTAHGDCEHSRAVIPIHSLHVFCTDQQMPSHVSVTGMYGSMPMGMYGMNLNSNMYQANYGIMPDQGKGKGKLVDAEFEAAFVQATASFSAATAETSRIAEVGDSATDVEQALENLTLGGDTKVDDNGRFEEFVVPCLVTKDRFTHFHASESGINCKILTSRHHKRIWQNGKLSLIR